MNSRERVTIAINHREPDKVPVDLAWTTVTSITYPVHDKLRKYLKLNPDLQLQLSHIHQWTAKLP